MKTVIIYYFSGSGNTLRIAKEVEHTFNKMDYDCKLIKMENTKDIKADILKSCAYIGLMFPVAIQSTFPLVWDFVNNLPECLKQKIFMIDTMEAYSGGVVGPMKKILSQKGYHCVGALEIPMSNSMETKEKKQKRSKSKDRKAPKIAEDFVVRLINGQTHWRRIPLLSDGMRFISAGKKIWAMESEKLSISQDDCINCGLCIRQCPLEALSQEEGVILINHDRCQCCMRCVTHCPKDAFRLKGKSVLRPM